MLSVDLVDALFQDFTFQDLKLILEIHSFPNKFKVSEIKKN